MIPCYFRAKWNNEVLVEIHQYLHSTAHDWHVAMSYNTTIQKVIASTMHDQVRVDIKHRFRPEILGPAPSYDQNNRDSSGAYVLRLEREDKHV